MRLLVCQEDDLVRTACKCRMPGVVVRASSDRLVVKGPAVWNSPLLRETERCVRRESNDGSYSVNSDSKSIRSR
jgi:hypothetical protein